MVKTRIKEVCEYAELLARPAHLETAAQALAQEREVDARAIAAVVEQLCERLHVLTWSQLALIQHDCRSWSDQLKESKEKLKESEEKNSRPTAELNILKIEADSLMVKA